MKIVNLIEDYQDDYNEMCARVRKEYNDRLANISTKEEFEEKWGKTLDRPVIYVISDKTVREEKLEVKDNKYIIDMEMDPEKANTRYARQMISMSNLEQPPSFKLLHLTFTVDMNYNLIQLDVHEKYTVQVVGTNESEATNEIKFYHNSTETIPDLETDYEY